MEYPVTFVLVVHVDLVRHRAHSRNTGYGHTCLPYKSSNVANPVDSHGTFQYNRRHGISLSQPFHSVLTALRNMAFRVWLNHSVRPSPPTAASVPPWAHRSSHTCPPTTAKPSPPWWPRQLRPLLPLTLDSLCTFSPIWSSFTVKQLLTTLAPLPPNIRVHTNKWYAKWSATQKLYRVQHSLTKVNSIQVWLQAQ